MIEKLTLKNLNPSANVEAHILWKWMTGPKTPYQVNIWKLDRNESILKSNLEWPVPTPIPRIHSHVYKF